MIKYLGSKRVLLPEIVGLVKSLSGVDRVLDAFSGSARVAHAFKQAGYSVCANDHATYAATLARSYVQADARSLLPRLPPLLDELNRLPPQPGFFTETYCIHSRYLQPHNGARVDAIRERIARLELDPVLEAVVLTSLMEAADRVDSTCGLQMAYLKQWSKRSYQDLQLRVPMLLPGEGQALQLDAREVVSEGWDLVYLDPPYNQHKYVNNYHVWETLVRWDAPEVYGRACKRIDCRSYDSPYNSKPRIAAAFRELLAELKSRYLLVSFSNEGHLSLEEIHAMLAECGEVEVRSFDYRRYVGARIGIYNPKGEKVGAVSHTRNQEYLFLVRCA